MEETVKILALGGLDEAGKDCYLVDISGELYVIGCGLRYPDKTMPGVDYVIPDCTYLIENKDRVKAYFLLHGHEDELGGLVYLYENAPAPVYGSDVTLAMLRLFAEKVGKGNVSFDLRPVEPTSTFKVGDRTCHFFQTAHSIARSSGLAIDTRLGHVVFTGDFVVENSADPNYLHDINAIARLAETPTLVLLSESGYAEKPGYTAPRHRLSHHVESAVKDAPGRTFARRHPPSSRPPRKSASSRFPRRTSPPTKTSTASATRTSSSFSLARDGISSARSPSLPPGRTRPTSATSARATSSSWLPPGATTPRSRQPTPLTSSTGAAATSSPFLRKTSSACTPARRTSA